MTPLHMTQKVPDVAIGWAKRERKLLGNGKLSCVTSGHICNTRKWAQPPTAQLQENSAHECISCCGADHKLIMLTLCFPAWRCRFEAHVLSDLKSIRLDKHTSSRQSIC